MKFINIFNLILLFLLLSACSTQTKNIGSGQITPKSIEILEKDLDDYQLDTGDIVKITVFNQENLSGKYTLNGAGRISLPLIGVINAKKITIAELKDKIVNKLKPDFLLDPLVSIQILNYRPYYIIGEVKFPQSYPYVSGMSYLNAIAIAGGYSYRAKKDYVYVIRMKDKKRREVKLSIDELVKPGDMIRVDERYF